MALIELTTRIGASAETCCRISLSAEAHLGSMAHTQGAIADRCFLRAYMRKLLQTRNEHIRRLAEAADSAASSAD